MGLHLLLTVQLHGDGQGTARYHGMAQGNPEWPPAPARVFQALACHRRERWKSPPPKWRSRPSRIGPRTPT